jgi:hypothetical protein
MLSTRRARFAAAVVAVAAVAGAGIAWSAIPGSDGVIHACYKDGTGALRVVDDPGACRAHETALDLGGPSHGYAVANPGDVTFSAPTSVSVLKLGLPAGTFLVHAKANLINLPGSDAVFVPCDLRLEGTSTMLDEDRVVLEALVTGAEAYEANVPLQAAVTLASPGVVGLECAAVTRGTSSTVDARFVQIDAVPLNALN